MFAKPTSVVVMDTFDGLGVSERTVDVEITAEYRASSAEFNILSVRAVGMCAAVCLDDCLYRANHEDWFEVLDEIVYNYAVKNYEHLIDGWLEELNNGS